MIARRYHLKCFAFNRLNGGMVFLCLLVSVRGVCGNVTDFISVLQANRGNLACLRPSAQSLAATKRFRTQAARRQGKVMPKI